MLDFKYTCFELKKLKLLMLFSCVKTTSILLSYHFAICKLQTSQGDLIVSDIFNIKSISIV